MAAPRHRRRGFSRRVQYGLFAGYVIAIVGILVAGAMLLMARFDPGAFGTVRGIVIDASAPFTGLGRAGIRGVRDAAGEIDAYFYAASKNRRLEQELADARRAVISAKTLEVENARLGRPPHDGIRLLSGSDPMFSRAHRP